MGMTRVVRRQSDGRQRHQNRRDVQCGGQNQAIGTQDLSANLLADRIRPLSQEIARTGNIDVAGQLR